jgi:hypothetical protein
MCANCIEVLKRALAVANAKRRPVARAARRRAKAISSGRWRARAAPAHV